MMLGARPAPGCLHRDNPVPPVTSASQRRALPAPRHGLSVAGWEPRGARLHRSSYGFALTRQRVTLQLHLPECCEQVGVSAKVNPPPVLP